ncbi:MAG: class I SAM-dependent methyltransferase [Aquaticitalea sp.]
MNNQHNSSFRDPSGYVFLDEGIIKRKIFPKYFEVYNSLKNAQFYEKLFKIGLLVPHKEVSASDSEIVLQPEQIPFITYPYEWSFNQYKEAALLTLKLQKYCLDHQFSLKDASAFNVTFFKGKAVFIDTLSFDIYSENSPWRAYKQFIMHFLGPLILAHYHGSQSLKLMSNFIDGIPLQMLASMLPFKTKFSPTLYSNIHLLAKFEDKHNEDNLEASKTYSLTKKAQLKIIESLYNFIKNLKLKEHTEWGDYYDKINYSSDAFQQKAVIINGWIEQSKAKTLIDVGGNDGTFVRKISLPIDHALVCDIDPNAIDLNYQTIRNQKETFITPFVLDVLNPSAAIGFENTERLSFLDRISHFEPDVTLALAVIHHISLSGNIPFERSAHFFAMFSKDLIIEFPDREDSWVQRLLNSKAEFKNHFDFYNKANFETAYFDLFNLIEKIEIKDSKRTMYLLKRK